jgi:uncharacterized RDD family membrane protein YckC
MTTPTPDSSGNIAPGLYHAEGDPPGTVRQWDGTQWVGGPVPAPPGAMAAPLRSKDQFGGVGIRIGASLLDVVISIALALVIGGTAAAGTSIDVGNVIAAVLFIGIQVFLIGQFGGTPGKLIVGLRITEADGTTTPPSWRHAAMRVIPIAILTSIPVVSFFAGITILVLCLVWVSSDAERRSPYDRIGDTRVVYKNKL